MNAGSYKKMLGVIIGVFGIIVLAIILLIGTSNMELFIAGVILGLIFIIMGILVRNSGVKESKRINLLLENGRVVNCIITDVFSASSGKYEKGIKVKCCNSDPKEKNETYISLSVYLADSDIPKVGDTVSVYVDRNNSKNYYVDVK